MLSPSGAQCPDGDCPYAGAFGGGIATTGRLTLVETAVSDNLAAAVDVAKGAMSLGMRDVTFDVAGCELMRVTGFLVRRADLDHVRDGVRHASTVLGAGSIDHMHLDERRAQRVRSHELEARAAR